ncbi:hypothetical protein MKY15_04815 [Sporosarcina sp. FSL K6-1540]
MRDSRLVGVRILSGGVGYDRFGGGYDRVARDMIDSAAVMIG